MTNQEIIDEAKLKLGGNILDIEITDNDLNRLLKATLRELTRYWDELAFITVPFASCIDTSTWDEKTSSIVGVFRANPDTNSAIDQGIMIDPLYAYQWNMFGNGGSMMYNITDYVMNYSSWSLLQSMRNTTSTELSWTEDRHNHKLYINNCSTRPDKVSIAYIPKLISAEDIKSDTWLDTLINLFIANVKITVGRARSRYKIANAEFEQDGEAILAEGLNEHKELTDALKESSILVGGID